MLVENLGGSDVQKKKVVLGGRCEWTKASAIKA